MMRESSELIEEPRTRDGELVLVYDGECPVCDLYCRLVDVRPSTGELKLVDARDTTSVINEITQAGLDIDQGMVLKDGNSLYYGSDAIHALALVSSRSGLFNRLNYWVFRFKSLSRALYPVLRSVRNLLLKILGRSKINNLKLENNERF